MDLHNVDAVDAPPHDSVRTTGENLEFNKKVSTMGDWYSYMPCEAPKQLKQNIALVGEMIDAVVERVKNDGEAGDLPIHEKPLKASCILDYLIRATDPDGKRLPEKYRSDAMVVTMGAGFITTGYYSLSFRIQEIRSGISKSSWSTVSPKIRIDA
jgi:hypothetical protein